MCKNEFNRNIEECFRPKLNVDEILIAILTGDDARLEEIKSYITDCKTKKDEAHAAIADLTTWEEMIPIVGKLEEIKEP